MKKINSKRKGKTGELEVVNYWKGIFPDAHRHLEFQVREAESGVDVVLDKYNQIQVKIGKQVPKTIYDFISQTKEESGIIKWVQCRRNKEKWLVILRAEDLLELFAILKGNELLK